MDMLIDALWILGIIVPAIMTGFVLGRRERKLIAQEEETEQAEREGGEAKAAEPLSAGKRHKNNERRIMLSKFIASPVDGEVSFFCEGGRKGAVIVPEQGKVYAPASGKIMKLYPMGTAFLLRTDDKMDLLIQVGRRQPDELCSMYYSSRIVQNEIVNKGKLLLSFDKESLLAAGEEVSVTVSIEDIQDGGEVALTQKESVKVGEELMRVW